MNLGPTYAISLVLATASLLMGCESSRSAPAPTAPAPTPPAPADSTQAAEQLAPAEPATLEPARAEPTIPLRARHANEQLLGTAWTSVDVDAAIRAVTFGETTISLLLADGTTETRWADFAAVHPLCFSYPRCVLTIDPAGRPAPLFLNVSETGLYFIECRNFADTHPAVEMPETDPELAAIIEAFPEWRNGTHYCFSLDPTVFTPRY